MMETYWKLIELIETVLDQFNPRINNFIRSWEKKLCLSHRFVSHGMNGII